MKKQIGQIIMGVGCFLFFSPELNAAPILVTRITDGVEIDDGSGKKAAPTTTFALMDGQSLHIPKGGIATVVSAGKAEQIIGPKVFTTSDSVGSADVAGSESSLDNLMSRQSSVSNVGATRGNEEFSLLLPVPDSKIISLGQLKWSCKAPACSAEDIELVQMDGFRTLWKKDISGTDRSLIYDGKSLPSGEYALKVNGNYIGFEVASSEEKMQVQAALKQAQKISKTLSETDQTAIEAGIWWQAGFPGQTLEVCEQALQKNPKNQDIKQMTLAYQKALGQ